jgi:hypothetical protein
MEELVQTRDETKHFRGFGSYVLWAGMVLVLYVLSIGPAIMIGHRKILPPAAEDFLGRFYFPMLQAYAQTPLHHSLGVYFHLWCPEDFDKNGDYLH